MKEIQVKKRKGEKKVIRLKVAMPEFNRMEEGKTISINDLPECKHKERLLKMVTDPKQAKIVVVVVRGSHKNIKKWEALAGYPDVRDVRINTAEVDKQFPDVDWLWLCENIRGADDVEILGERLPYDVAVKLFPDWAVLSYLE